MAEAKIAVVDYCKGNLKSVERGLRFVGGAGASITADPADIAAADAIVLPGVGAFADASCFMQDSGQMDVVRDKIHAGTPFLGICLGEHLLFTEGVEGAPEGEPAVGLGIVHRLGQAPCRHLERRHEYSWQHRRVLLWHLVWRVGAAVRQLQSAALHDSGDADCECGALRVYQP